MNNSRTLATSTINQLLQPTGCQQIKKKFSRQRAMRRKAKVIKVAPHTLFSQSVNEETFFSPPPLCLFCKNVEINFSITISSLMRIYFCQFICFCVIIEWMHKLEDKLEILLKIEIFWCICHKRKSELNPHKYNIANRMPPTAIFLATKEGYVLFSKQCFPH